MNKKARPITNDTIICDLQYHLAQCALCELLDDDKITFDELNKITALNRETFLPYLREILPKAG